MDFLPAGATEVVGVAAGVIASTDGDVGELEGEPPQADKLSPSVEIRTAVNKDLVYFIDGNPPVWRGAHDNYGADGAYDA